MSYTHWYTQVAATERSARSRLVFLRSGGVGHAPYLPEPVSALERGNLRRPAGVVVRVACAYGDHYLAPDETLPGRVVERTVHGDALVEMYRWRDIALALAAIEQLATQRREHGLA